MSYEDLLISHGPWLWMRQIGVAIIVHSNGDVSGFKRGVSIWGAGKLEKEESLHETRMWLKYSVSIWGVKVIHQEPCIEASACLIMSRLSSYIFGQALETNYWLHLRRGFFLCRTCPWFDTIDRHRGRCVLIEWNGPRTLRSPWQKGHEEERMPRKKMGWMTHWSRRLTGGPKTHKKCILMLIIGSADRIGVKCVLQRPVA